MTGLAMRQRVRLSLIASTVLVVPTMPAAAQQARDSLRLAALHADALRTDPRGQQLELLAAQSTLRLRNLDAERLPALTVNLLGQYLSDVPTFPFQLPGGASPTVPPNDNSDANVAARQRLYDPTLAPRRGVERAQLAESQARVRSTLYTLRQNVNDAFFAALLLQAQRAELETGITDLEAHLRAARDRVQLGSALGSEAATLEAELLRRRQSIADVAASRDAALAVLGDLTGRPLTPQDVLALPDLGTDVAQARSNSQEQRARPEYAQFDRAREVLSQRHTLVNAQERPRLFTFARAGYGRPGLNPLATAFDEYWLAGVQVEWSPWRWGTTQREREEVAIQQRIVATEEAAFTAGIRRSLANDLAAIDRLENSLQSDDEIIALRERILREARLRFGENVITSAELVDRETDVLAARLARATHRVELARSRARFLTLIGLEVR
jgi:outer membrane protein TolC